MLSDNSGYSFRVRRLINDLAEFINYLDVMKKQGYEFKKEEVEFYLYLGDYLEYLDGKY